MYEYTFAIAFLKEIEAKAAATKKCIERIPESTFEFKPHPKNVKMDYLTLLVAEIPLWNSYHLRVSWVKIIIG